MKAIIRKVVLLLDILILLNSQAFAYSSTEYTDVPQDHWAQGDIMSMTDEGIFKGTGNGKFEPLTKVSTAMLLTIIGRVVYNEEAEVISARSDNWYSAYVSLADEMGVLDGTDIDLNEVENAVSRYDVAKILNFYLNLLSIELADYDTGKIADYTYIPARYLEDVTQVFAIGLIKGYEDGRFGGERSITRAEMATVTVRLIALMDELKEGEAKTHKLTIEAAEGGTIPAGMDALINGYYTSGDRIGIIAREMPGYFFVEWRSSNGGSFDNQTSTQTYFTMPDSDTVITGVFREITG